MATCNNLVCDSFHLVTVDGNGEVGGYPSVGIMNNGYPIISFYQEQYKKLQVIFFN